MAEELSEVTLKNRNLQERLNLTNFYEYVNHTVFIQTKFELLVKNMIYNDCLARTFIYDYLTKLNQKLNFFEMRVTSLKLSTAHIEFPGNKIV